MISTDKFNDLDDYHPSTPVSNMPFDESMEFRNSDYISSECMEISDEQKETILLEREDVDAYDKAFDKETYCQLPPAPPSISEKYKYKIGDGKMIYINNNFDRKIMTNAWEAITQTNNWDFVSQEIISFMWSDDPRIDEIMEKMEELGFDGHSGCSFGSTMRNMQFLVKNGEEEFKKLFEKPKKD